MKVSADVYVTLQVKVYVGRWGSEGSFESLREQAKREAVDKLRLITANSGSIILDGYPTVMSVVMKEE